MEKQIITTFEEAEAYLNSAPRFTSKHEMAQTKEFLRLLGNPEKGLRIVHVAGTNGKGSVCTFMQSILRAGGYSVGLFTSPHLVDVRERFRIDDELMSREDFLRLFLQIYDMLDWDALLQDQGYHPTYFEYIFFIGILYFAEKQPDYCILETGLGGRLDATNSVSQKELSVITRISLDHVQYLGDTVEQIAAEKAGIIMEKVPVVYGAFEEPSEKVFAKKASECFAPAFPVGTDLYFDVQRGGKNLDFSMSTLYYNIARLSIPIGAVYQVENAAIAVRAVEVLMGRDFPLEAIREGLAVFYHAGRFEQILPEVIVDGAHNEDGIRAFLESVETDACAHRWLLFGAVSDKDVVHMVSQIAENRLFEDITIVPMQTGRSLSLKALQDVFAGYSDLILHLGEDAESALLHLLKERSAGVRIYVAGSLYLVGEVKAALRAGVFDGF